MQVYATSDCDWFCAASAAEARRLALELYGDEDYVIPLDEISPVDDEAMGKLVFQDPDSGESRSFKEELQRRIDANEPPGIFASTEY